MRLLHTSDWHLGRSLHGVDLIDAQAAVLDQLVGRVGAADVDAVLICGDVFDRAVPPVGAVRLWDRVLRELSDQVPVVIIPGNHDSATRLGVGATLYRDGVRIVTDLDDIGLPVTLADEHGPVHIYPVPFLDPDVARHALTTTAEPLERSHAAVMVAALDRVRANLRALASPGRSVVMAHAFVVAGPADELDEPQRSESERDIRVGGVDSIPVGVFEGFDYVALGHLHGAQSVGSGPVAGRVRYSGSPLRYSFSETRQRKQASLVEIGADGSVTVEPVDLVQPREMSAIVGTFEELLADPAFAASEEHWVQVTVTDPARPAQMAPRVKERFPHALVVRHLPQSGPLATGPSAAVPASPLEVAESFVHYVTGGDITSEELAVFQDAYEHVVAAGRES